ncbi:hypothetical protein [Rosistilla ulvae]|nr:hypothetical protein [Rosistilla ulvae]
MKHIPITSFKQPLRALRSHAPDRFELREMWQPDGRQYRADA